MKIPKKWKRLLKCTDCPASTQYVTQKEGVRAALFADNVSSRLLPAQGRQRRIVGKRHGHFWIVEYGKKRSAVLLYLYDWMLARCNCSKMDKNVSFEWDRPIGTEFHVSVQLANAVSQQWRNIGKRHAHFWKVECVKKRSAVLLYLYDSMLARCNGSKMDKNASFGWRWADLGKISR